MVALVATASSATSLSGALHGTALFVAVVRLFLSFSFNPRFGIITATMARSFPELTDHLFVTAILLIMLSALANLNMLEDVSSAPASMYFMFKFLVTGDLGDMHSVAASADGLERLAVSSAVSYVLYNLLPYLIGYGVVSFIISIIAFKYYELKFEQGTPPSMFSEAHHVLFGHRKLRRVARCMSAALKNGRQTSTVNPKAAPLKSKSIERGEAAKHKKVRDSGVAYYYYENGVASLQNG